MVKTALILSYFMLLLLICNYSANNNLTYNYRKFCRKFLPKDVQKWENIMIYVHSNTIYD